MQLYRNVRHEAQQYYVVYKGFMCKVFESCRGAIGLAHGRNEKAQLSTAVHAIVREESEDGRASAVWNSALAPRLNIAQL